MEKQWLAIACVCICLGGCSKNEVNPPVLESSNQIIQKTEQVNPNVGDMPLEAQLSVHSKEDNPFTVPTGPELSEGEKCEGFNCKCGDTTCSTGAICRSGACYCGDKETRLAGHFYECNGGQMKCIGYGGFDLCGCGPNECSQGTVCIESDGTCLCNGKPSPLFVQKDIGSWVCEKDNWICASGTKNLGIGCTCDSVRCLWGSTCENDKCKCGHRTVLDDPSQYICEHGKVICDKADGCDCGKTKCKQGKQCVEGTCI